MKPKFKIVGTFQIKGQSYVLTEYLDEMMFRVETNYLLGDLPIHNFSESLNRLNEDGTPNDDGIIFLLKNRGDIKKVVIGQMVELRKQIIN